MKIKNFLKSYDGKHKGYLQDFFKNCPDDMYITVLEIDKGKTVVRQDSLEKTIFILFEGQVQTVVRQKKASDHSFEDYDDKVAFFGEYELFGEEDRFLADVIAKTDAKFIAIKNDDYLKWMRNDVDILFYRVKNIIKELLTQTKQGRRSLYMPSVDRMILYFVDYYERYKKNEFDTVIVKETRQEIAQKVGFHTRTVNRSTKELIEKNIIDIKKGKIIITPKHFNLMKTHRKDI